MLYSDDSVRYYMHEARYAPFVETVSTHVTPRRRQHKLFIIGIKNQLPK